MEVSSQTFADVVVAAPAGRIDHSNAERLKQALAPIVDAPADPLAALVLDFHGVEYISSMGLRVLLMAAKQLRGRHARIAVAALQPVVEEIFAIARFDHVLEVFPTTRVALEQVSSSALAAYDAAAG